MLTHGRVRVSPATDYQANFHNYAIRDAEVERSLIVPTYRERLAGVSAITFQGNHIYFGSGDLEIPVAVPNYYVYCLAQAIYYRLPTDFEADAALVIRDPVKFVYLLKRAFCAACPGYRPISGAVQYYDPYIDFKKATETPWMVKHFRYSYQREFRVAFLPRHGGIQPALPINLDLGSMRDYADLIEF